MGNLQLTFHREFPGNGHSTGPKMHPRTANAAECLKEYEDTKGFSSKMTEVIEGLYTQKTHHEDIDDFLRSMFICSYCADKLRSGKDVARSAFNKRAVIETPSCIKELNLFELALIKFCMTCVTVVRLGQVTYSTTKQ